MTNFYFYFFFSIDNERQPLYVNAPPKPRRIHNEMEYPSIGNDVSMFPLRYTLYNLILFIPIAFHSTENRILFSALKHRQNQHQKDYHYECLNMKKFTMKNN